LPISRLTRLQGDLLEAFFKREQRFFLTGGAALAGFHLGHRRTDDLDLFVTEDVLDQGDAALYQAAESLGAGVERDQTHADFRRRIVRRGEEAVIVDLVRDRAAQVMAKEQVGTIRIDSPLEILANKLCTLFSRSEARDFVDVFTLDRAGFRVEDALPLAQQKEGNISGLELAWVLSQIRIGDDADLPGGVSIPEMRVFLEELQRRLTPLGHPRRSP
jgi:hypothetical protein